MKKTNNCSKCGIKTYPNQKKYCSKCGDIVLFGSKEKSKKAMDYGFKLLGL